MAERERTTKKNTYINDPPEEKGTRIYNLYK